MKRIGTVVATVAVASAVVVALAPAASARPSAPSAPLTPSRGAASSLGTTTVTTAPGIATTLLSAGIVPLPQPGTSLGVSFGGGLQVSYGFPITRSTANLSTVTGNILHGGGITFVSLRGKLAIGRFDISLADRTIYSTTVNGAAARVPTLTVDLSGLRVTTTRDGGTLLSGIGLNLAPAAARAINSTFGTALPTNGSLRFGSATVLLRG
ncbi:hypothetical protein ACXR2U_12590 [Jatrophihabitans sp. YIM 134969]